jgi:hypothetical protein
MAGLARDHSLIPSIVDSADVECTGTDTTEIISVDLDRVKLIICNPVTNSNTMRLSDSNAAADHGFPLAPGVGIVLDGDCSMAWSAYNPGSAESLTVTAIKRAAA